MQLLKFLAPAATAALLSLAGAAGATTLDCTQGNVTYALGNAANKQCLSGNDSESALNAANLFGFNTWILADKTDDAISGDQAAVLSIAGIGGASPTWSIATGGNSFQQLVIVLKQAGSGFAAFLVDQTFALNGTWSTSQTNPQGKVTSTNDLSHGSLYYVGKETAVVPLPAAVWLMLSGVGALAAAGLRRRRATA